MTDRSDVSITFYLRSDNVVSSCSMDIASLFSGSCCCEQVTCLRNDKPWSVIGWGVMEYW